MSTEEVDRVLAHTVQYLRGRAGDRLDHVVRAMDLDPAPRLSGAEEVIDRATYQLRDRARVLLDLI